MTDLLQSLTQRTRELALSDTALSPQTALATALDEVAESQPTAMWQEASLKAQAEQQLFGFGVLDIWLTDPAVEEIWINRPNEVFVATPHGVTSHPVELDDSTLQTIVERMLRHTGRRLDRSSPFVDASLPDGSRLHVVIPDITRGWSVNIRKFPKGILTLDRLVGLGSLSSQLAADLSRRVKAGANILVSGATQAGKTTMLCALLAELDPGVRIVSVEETFELRTNSRDWVALQARQANLEGVGEVTLRRLVKEALRMRPSRLIVGEVREAESLDLLIALNSGLAGASTIHANSAAEAITKLCTLPLLAGPNISSDFVLPTVANCIDLVVHCGLDESGRRSVQQVVEVEWGAASRQIALRPLFEAHS